jgi:hypothetical protein
MAIPQKVSLLEEFRKSNLIFLGDLLESDSNPNPNR